jgi:hypothetical protein
MPPLVLILAGVLGGMALVRLASRARDKTSRKLDTKRQDQPNSRSDVPQLRRDPVTGTYRPG